ncbi:MAG: GNAT family N-acetyltransferase, partial [Anaeromyxobacteraceae bacterium]
MTRSLLVQPRLSPTTRLRLEDSRRIVGELARVLAGEEEGEGTRTHRTLWTARLDGRVQGVASLFLCESGTFVELVATAPWNLLGDGDPVDSRKVRGAGRALLDWAATWSRATERLGRVALQAENPRSRAVYERMGFRRMEPRDRPLSLVPRGLHGFSASILRLAAGAAGPEESASPWMLLDPAAARPA